MRRPAALRFALVALSAVWIGRSHEAHAQSNTAIAEQLFVDGEQLMKSDHVAEACGKFADSQRLDPAVGTLMHLALCHEKMGKLASAWSEFNDVAGQAQRARQHDREDFARHHAAALDPKLQKIIIELSRPPDGTAIRLDDVVLPLGVLGTEIPLDPGDHTLQVTAPGMKPWRQAKLNVGPSAVVTRVQVMLEEEAVVPKALAAPVPAPSAPEVATKPPPPTKLIVGIGLGVLGLGSAAVGVIEGVGSAGRTSDENKYPVGDTNDRQTVANQAGELRNFAIAFGAAGAAAVGVGIYLVVTSHKQAAAPPTSAYVSPLAGPGLAGLALHYAW